MLYVLLQVVDPHVAPAALLLPNIDVRILFLFQATYDRLLSDRPSLEET